MNAEFLLKQFDSQTRQLYKDVAKSAKSSIISIPGDPPAKGVKFEVQIKTILSHSWAEITHDIGYKPSSPIPEDAKRKMFRIAALLELADKEFVGFKNLCNTFNDAFLLQNSKDEEEIPISEQSLQIYLNDKNFCTNFENSNSQYGGRPFNTSLKAIYHNADMVRSLHGVNVKTIHDLSKALKDHSKLLKEQIIDNYCGGPNHSADKTPPERGFVLMFLVRLLYIKKSDEFLAEIGPI